jgi:hypothetical protein
VPVFLGFGKRKVPEEVTVSKKVEVRSKEILANGNNERLFQLTYACPSRESVGTRKSTDTYDLLLPESQAKLLWDAMFPKQGPAPGPNLLIEFLKTRIFTAQKGLLPVEQDTFRMRPEGRESNVLLLRRNTIDYSEKIEAREVKYTPDLKQDNRKKV